MPRAYYVIRYEYARDGRCAAQVRKRDAYRYTGRTKGGFEMHYTRQQCSRNPLNDSEWCWQHDIGQPRAEPATSGAEGAT